MLVIATNSIDNSFSWCHVSPLKWLSTISLYTQNSSGKVAKDRNSQHLLGAISCRLMLLLVLFIFCVNAVDPQQTPSLLGIICVPILKMGKLRNKEVAQDHTV